MKNIKNTKASKGFSLIEISIVLVVVALIIAGIMGGQSLLAAAERQAVAKELQKLEGAMVSFKQQYNQIAGDMDNSSDYWPSLGGDGDGNGYLDNFDDECVTCKAHLKAAEIYNEMDASYEIKSALSKGFYQTCSSVDNGFENEYFSVADGHTIYDKNYNYIMLATVAGEKGVLNAADAQEIDKKLDDGKASSGLLVAIRGEGTTSGSYATSGCVDSVNKFTDTDSEGTVNYDLSDKTKNCRLIYLLKAID